MHYSIFGSETLCPHCRQMMTLTDTYLCQRHGAFEADPKTEELVHSQSGRRWRLWEGEWYRQHTHPDGIVYEIHEALDRLYTEGFRAKKVIIAQRYRALVNLSPCFKQSRINGILLYGIPVEFSPYPLEDPRWQAINFDLDKEYPG